MERLLIHDALNETGTLIDNLPGAVYNPSTVQRPARAFRIGTFALPLLLLAAPVASQPEPARLAVGINVLGGQVDYQLGRALRLEARALTGSSASESGRVSSAVAGLRGYRIFRFERATRPFLGAEASWVDSRAKGASYRASGPALGAFVGVERRLASRTWIGFDAGPYLFALHERTTRTAQTSLEFVANSFVMIYLF